MRTPRTESRAPSPVNGAPAAQTRIEASAAQAAEERFRRARTRLETGMAEWTPELKKLWDDRFPDLVSYLTVATSPWQWNVADLQASIKRAPTAPTLILVGERGTVQDPLDNGQYKAALQAVKLVENAPFQIMFTGGVYGLEAFYGERPAWSLAQDFDLLTGGAYARHISVEQFSQNTGHQARVLGEIIRRVGFGRVVVCIPIEHVARFAATLGFDMVERWLADGEKAKADGKAAPKLAEMIFFGNGDWEDLILHRRMTRAREAFGPVQALDDPDLVLATKRLGGEYGERYHVEQDLERSRGYACPALSPKAMLEAFNLGK